MSKNLDFKALERCALVRDLEGVRQATRVIERDYTALCAERDQAKAHYDLTQRSLKLLTKQLDHVIAEREEAVTERDALRAERDALQATVQAAQPALEERAEGYKCADVDPLLAERDLVIARLHGHCDEYEKRLRDVDPLLARLRQMEGAWRELTETNRKQGEEKMAAAVEYCANELRGVTWTLRHQIAACERAIRTPEQEAKEAAMMDAIMKDIR